MRVYLRTATAPYQWHVPHSIGGLYTEEAEEFLKDYILKQIKERYQDQVPQRRRVLVEYILVDAMHRKIWKVRFPVPYGIVPL